MNIDYHALLPINGKKFKQGMLVATVVNIPGPQQNSNNILYLTRFDGTDLRMINLWVAEETLRLNPNAHREVFKAVDEWLKTDEGYNDAPDRFFDDKTKSLIRYDREKGPIRDNGLVFDTNGRLNSVIEGLDEIKARSIASAWTIQDEGMRISALIDLAQELSPLKADIVYLDLLEKILRAPSVSYRRDTIARITPHLNQALLSTLVEELKKEPNEDDRVRLFDFVFPFLSLPQLESLASYGDTLNNDNDRNSFLARVAESLASKGNIERALGISEHIYDTEVRDKSLSKILAYSKRINPENNLRSVDSNPPPSRRIDRDEDESSEESSPPEEVMKIASRVLADVADEELDLLDFGEYADALAALISDDKTQKPLTIGIDAAWGMGKTQLMKMVRRRLTTPVSNQLRDKVKGRSGFPTVWFNAWKYDREDALWAALVLEILDQSTKGLPPWDSRLLRLRLRLRRVNGKSVVVAASLLLLALLVPFGIVLLIRSSPILGSLFLSIGLLSTAGAYPFVKSVFQRLKTLQQDLSKYIQTPDYKEKIGFLAQFEKDFGRVIDIVTDKGKWPLVVFIDDLDRCGPAEAVEIVEAINILLDSRHCVFVIGMDAKSVAQSIESKYKSLRETYTNTTGALTLGERFLEKILQINFKIPPSQKHQVQRLIKKHFEVSKVGIPNLPLTEADEKRKLAEELIQAEQRGGETLEQATDSAIKRVATTNSITKEDVHEARKTLSERAFEDDERVQRAVAEAAPYLDFNPRKIKKFINNFRLHALIAQRRGLFHGTAVSVNSLAKAVVISMRWPEIASSMSSDGSTCKNLKESFDSQERLRFLESSEPQNKNEMEAEKALAKIRTETVTRFIEIPDVNRLLSTMSDDELGDFARCFNLPASES